ncbi:hypothetical protein ACXYMU_00225 [Pontibacter sp. CAU 1760]
MKTLLKKVSKAFKPKYEVVCTTYQVIPGLPVNMNESKHSFGRGESKEAQEFYSKVISSDMTKTMAPVEVQLRRIYLRTTTVNQAEFGPVQHLKTARKAAKKK